MKRDRRVKIVATLGPASSTRTMIKDLFLAGADVFRLNMSHGTQAEIAERHQIIREVEHEMQRPISILADLQGPKLRCGVFANGSEMLEEGASFRFDLDEKEG
ncbi:MAG: pyruvate kinase, partial [Pseudomonadota bacterium]